MYQGIVEFIGDLFRKTGRDAAFENADPVNIDIFFDNADKIQNDFMDLVLISQREFGDFVQIRAGEHIFADFVEKGIDIPIMQIKSGYG